MLLQGSAFGVGRLSVPGKAFCTYAYLALLCTAVLVATIRLQLILGDDAITRSQFAGTATLGSKSPTSDDCAGVVKVPGISQLEKVSIRLQLRPNPVFAARLSGREANPTSQGDIAQVNSTLAVVVPYRDRRDNLRRFLEHMVPFLCAQKLHFWIFVVNQTKDGLFNRAKLCNVGFLEAEWYKFDYVVFHDVDKLPVDKRNSYSWPFKGRPECAAYHMAVSVEQFGYKSLGDRFVGGALMFSVEQFRRIGGMPNFYWGWGAEDDETYDRIKKRSQGKGDWVCRPPDDIARYLSVSHKGDAPGKLVPDNNDRYKCNYEMMVDYREGRRDTDKMEDAKYDIIHYVTWEEFRTTVVTVDVCKGNYKSRCNKRARDVSCPE